MSKLYLTRKWIFQQEADSSLPASNCIAPAALNSAKNDSLLSNYLNREDVEDLEMLLEAYFMQLDFTLNKIQLLRQYIEAREGYANIKLDNQRNKMMQMQLTLTNASFAVQVETALAGIFGMNIPCKLYEIKGIFGQVVGLMTAACVLLFILCLVYARKKLP